MNALSQARDFLHSLESCSSITDKKSILANLPPETQEMFLYALDPYRKFGIQAIPALISQDTSEEPDWPEVKFLLDKLAGRIYTGDKAKHKVAKMLFRLSAPGRLMFTRILRKDLRCGVGSTLLNAVIPGLVPEFGLQLATPLEGKHIKNLQKRKTYYQDKKNGDRCVVMCPIGGQPELLTRKGHTLHNYSHIGLALMQVAMEYEELLREELGDQYEEDSSGLVFDGEVIRGDFFQTRSVKKSKGNDAPDAVFYCFDVVDLKQWKAGRTDTFSIRLKLLKTLEQTESWQYHPDCLVRVKSYVFKNPTWELCEELRDKLVSKGEEGVMFRPDLPYNFKTRSSIYKFKKMKEADLLIDHVVLGEEGKKHGHHAGAIAVVAPSGGVCSVGIHGNGGFDTQDEYRDWLWKNRKKLVGRMAEIHYQEETVNKAGEPKLQFGEMYCLRPDKD